MRHQRIKAFAKSVVFSMEIWPAELPEGVNHRHILSSGGKKDYLGAKLRMGHVFGMNQRVEFFAGEEAELDGGFAQADVLVVRGVRDFGCIVVADLGR